MSAAQPARTPDKGRRLGWLVVVAAGLAVSLGAFDSNAATAVLPDIGRDLGADPDAVQWIVLAYLIPIAALALGAGTWFGTAGQRPAMILLVGGFSVASVAAGFAPNIELMIAARTAQGLFGAGLFSAAMVVALAAVGQQHRARVIALMTTSGALGGVAGPSLGSLIAAAWGWPWVFAVCGPIGALIILVFAVGIPTGGSLPIPTVRMAVDALLIGVAVTAVLLALTFGPDVPATFLLALAAAPALLVWWRRSRETTVGRLLSAPGVHAILVAVLCAGVAGMGIQFALAFFARDAGGLSVEQTGVVLAIVAIATAVFAQIGVPLHRFVSPEVIGAAGFTVFAVGIASMIPLGPDWSFGDLAIRAAIIGSSQGLTLPSLSASLFSRTTPPGFAEASATQHLVRTVGFAAGPAVVVSLWSALSYRTEGIQAALVVVAVAAIIGVPAFLVAARSRVRTTPGG